MDCWSEVYGFVGKRGRVVSEDFGCRVMTFIGGVVIVVDCLRMEKGITRFSVLTARRKTEERIPLLIRDQASAESLLIRQVINSTQVPILKWKVANIQKKSMKNDVR